MQGSKDALKRRVCESIDRHGEKIIEIGERVWRQPEPGFRETETARVVAEELAGLGLECEEGVGITGILARMPGTTPRPNIAVMGEMDALVIPEHPEACSRTGAVHACGHHAQVASLIGLAIGLSESGIMGELDGTVTLMAVPSEEPIEITWRQTLRKQEKLFFLGGKQEFIRLGKFDDVDVAIIDHLDCDPEGKIALGGDESPGPGMDGFIAKLVRYKGVESHAGVAPEKGVNALNAAMLGLIGIHAQRETFSGRDSVRVHQIITGGGDSLNVTPADVRMEMMVRAATVEAIREASAKVDRALEAGAMAIGAEVEIEDIPGYLPSAPTGSPSLASALNENWTALVGEDAIARGSSEPRPVRVPSGGVSDGNDVANIMPVGSMVVNAGRGRLHGRDFETADKELAYVVPAKAYAMTIVDLLYDGAKLAREVIASFEPAVPKDGYTNYWRDILSPAE